MIGYIYGIFNIKTEKWYIGQSVTPYTRIRNHFKKSTNIHLRNSIQYHGYNNFLYIILDKALSKEELNNKEKIYISEYDSIHPKGYNIQTGGDSYLLHGDTKLKISKANKEYYKHNNHPFKGKTFSKEHKEALSKIRKGFTSPNRKKASAERGIKFSRKIICTNIHTQEVLYFSSIKECARILKLCHGNISKVCNKKENRSQHNGYYFEFAPQYKNAIRE